MKTPAALLLSIASIFACSVAVAQNTLYWDGDGSGPVSGGSGTWDFGSPLWSMDLETPIYGPWQNGADAFFLATGGTVTLADPISVGSLNFGVDGYTLTSSTFDLTFSTGTATIDTSGGQTTLDVSLIASSGGLVKTGAGTLVLAATQSGLAGTTVRDGTLVLAASSSLLHTSRSLVVGFEAGDDARFDILGTAAAGSVRIGQNMGSSGEVVVGGTLTPGSSLIVGSEGDGTLTVDEGGSVDFAGDIRLGSLIGSTGTAPELRQLGMVLNDAFERLHHSLEQQRNLTANASHELRTPVSLLLELASALRVERTPEEYQERLTVALDATQHLAHLIDGLLILARSDAGLLQYEMEELRLDELVSDVVKIMSRKVGEQNVEIRVELAPVRIHGNGESLRQVLINLLDNALEHARGLTHVSVSLDQQEKTVRLIIADDGIGIAPELMPHLFNRFFRGEAARTSNAKGHLGLGLTICRTIVEAHAGTIRVARSAQGGASFLVELPEAKV